MTYYEYLYNLPPVPQTDDCQNKNKCEFANNEFLLGCHTGLNNNYVCKEAVTKQQREDNKLKSWAACPYQCKMDNGKCLGNWRWNAEFDSNGNALRCNPPADGTKGYKNNTLYSSEYYL